MGMLAGYSSQNDDRVWGYTTEDERSAVRFLGKVLNAKDIHK
jgi:hypothetical protein